jgi:hypothetical protein
MIQSGTITEISGRMMLQKSFKNHSGDIFVKMHLEQKLMLTPFSLTSNTLLNGVSN